MHLVGIEVGAGHDRAAAADDLDPRYGLVGPVRIRVGDFDVEFIFPGRPDVRAHDLAVHTVDDAQIFVERGERAARRHGFEYACGGQLGDEQAGPGVPFGDPLPAVVVAARDGGHLPAFGEGVQERRVEFRPAAVDQFDQFHAAARLFVVAVEIVVGVLLGMVEADDGIGLFGFGEPVVEIFDAHAVGHRVEVVRRIVDVHVAPAVGTVVLRVFVSPECDERGVGGGFGRGFYGGPCVGRIDRILRVVGYEVKVVTVLFGQFVVAFGRVLRVEGQPLLGAEDGDVARIVAVGVRISEADLVFRRFGRRPEGDCQQDDREKDGVFFHGGSFCKL